MNSDFLTVVALEWSQKRGLHRVPVMYVRRDLFGLVLVEFLRSRFSCWAIWANFGQDNAQQIASGVTSPLDPKQAQDELWKKA